MKPRMFYIRLHAEMWWSPEVRSLSDGAARLWVDVMMLANKADQRGTVNITLERLGKYTGNSTAEIAERLAELSAAGLITRDGDRITSPEIVSEAEQSAIKTEAGRAGLNARYGGLAGARPSASPEPLAPARTPELEPPAIAEQSHTKPEPTKTPPSAAGGRGIQGVDSGRVGGQVWASIAEKRSALFRLGVSQPVLLDFLESPHVTPRLVAKITKQLADKPPDSVTSPGGWAVNAIRAEIFRAVEAAPRHPNGSGVPRGQSVSDTVQGIVAKIGGVR